MGHIPRALLMRVKRPTDQSGLLTDYRLMLNMGNLWQLFDNLLKTKKEQLQRTSASLATTKAAFESHLQHLQTLKVPL